MYNRRTLVVFEWDFGVIFLLCVMCRTEGAVRDYLPAHSCLILYRSFFCFMIRFLVVWGGCGVVVIYIMARLRPII